MPAPRFAHSATEELYRYWDRRRGSRPAPDRSEIEPGEIRTILPDTFILEADPAMGYTWRLAGTRVCALHCRELKGRDFLGDWHGQHRETMQSLLNGILRDHAVAVLQFSGRTDRNQTLDMEMVLLPLRVFGRPTCRVLGAIGTMDQPYWVGLHPPLRRTIDGVRLLWPSGEPGLFEDPALEPPALDFETAAPDTLESMRRYRHLMVLDGGKSG